MRRALVIMLGTGLVGVAATAACRTARPDSAPAAHCANSASGTLRVRNFTGRVLEIYESGRGSTEFIGFASPGVTELPVRGPSELGIVYHVREASEGRDAVTVTWLRTQAVAQPPARLVVELRCR